MTLKGIDTFKRANEHVKIGVSVLQLDAEYEKGQLKDKKRALNLGRALAIESVKHWVSLLYEPASELDGIRPFFSIPYICKVSSKGKGS